MDLKAFMEKTARQSIITNYYPTEEKVALGKSKFGGNPHLPEGFRWDYYEGEDYRGKKANRPLSFLAQINLGEVADLDTENLLPKKGMLYFFYELATMNWGYDPEDKGCARVYYVENTDGLKETPVPEDMEENYIIPEFAMDFSIKMSLPDYEELAEYYDIDEKIDWDDYEELAAEMNMENMEEVSKLLGFADLIQGSPLMECEQVTDGIYSGGIVKLTEAERKEILEKSKDWTLLFQMSTLVGDNYELMFGDGGSIYFYIKKQDLKEKNFDKVWLVLQCF